MRARAVLQLLLTTTWCVAAVVAQEPQCSAPEQEPPYVEIPNPWLPSSINIAEIPTKDVVSFMKVDSESCSSSSDGKYLLKPEVIGKLPQFRTQDALQVVDEAVAAWKGGTGIWTAQYSLPQRIAAIRSFFRILQAKEAEIVQVLQWEIGKNTADAQAEFSRTVSFANSVMDVLETDPEFTGVWKTVSGIKVLQKRAAIGVVMALAPYNYPLNECYAAIIPALLLGNIVIIKIPTTGGLAHLLTFQALSEALPPGAIHFVSGGGRATMPPIMETGHIDALAFIGGSNAADQLIHAHPHPHRLKVFLQLEAKNMGVVLPDAFEDEAFFQQTIGDLAKGALSFNGQRCTAIKLLFCPSDHIDLFLDKFTSHVEEKYPVGLPWEKHADGSLSKITPLPFHGRVSYMKELLDDALKKGARIINKGGGEIIGGNDSTLMRPAVLFPVTPEMRIHNEEQFGPIVPIVTYDDINSILKMAEEGEYAQQIAVFGRNSETISKIVDSVGAIFGKININGQCGRSPDVLPFSGRRSSAMGVMSIKHALLEFSVPTVVSLPNPNTAYLAEQLTSQSKFLDTTKVEVA